MKSDIGGSVLDINHGRHNGRDRRGPDLTLQRFSHIKGCNTWAKTGVTTVVTPGERGVTTVLQWCYNGVTTVFGTLSPAKKLMQEKMKDFGHKTAKSHSKK